MGGYRKNDRFQVRRHRLLYLVVARIFYGADEDPQQLGA
jgi:hypothetical protein